MAIASLVLGLVWIYGVGSVLAVIFGLVARRQIKERNESGDGMAIAGIILGIIGIVGIILVIILIAALADDDIYSDYDSYDWIRTGLSMVWLKVSAAAAGLVSALPRF